MMKDKSLKRNLNADDKINEIKLALNSKAGCGIIWLLVEGDSDCRVYSKFVINISVSVEFVQGGKYQLETALKELNKITNKVLAIRDADFLHLEKTYSDFDNLFYTDYHDIEMTMLSFDSVRNNLFSEYHLPCSSDLWTNILKECSFPGYIRWYNDNVDCRLNFKKLSFANLIEYKLPEPISLDQSQLIEDINTRSSNKKNLITASIIEDFINTNKTDDYLNLCNGHDIVSILSHLAGTQVSEKELHRHLRISFRIEDFEKTKLYNQLTEWESTTGFELLA